jgi:hypothetical protein
MVLSACASSRVGRRAAKREIPLAGLRWGEEGTVADGDRDGGETPRFASGAGVDHGSGFAIPFGDVC